MVRRALVWVARVLGIALSVAGVVFVALAISAEWSIARRITSPIPGWLFLAWVSAALAMLVIASLWRLSIRVAGGAIEQRRATALFLIGEVAKYIPGGPWAVVGRGELAHRAGVSRRTSYWSVLLSHALLMLSAATVAAGSLPLARHAPTSALWGLVVLPVGLVVLHPRVLGAVGSAAERLTGRPLGLQFGSWRRLVVLLLLHIPAWLAIGFVTWTVSHALGVSTRYEDALFATSLSWLAGLLMLPVPAGVGIREATFIAVASFMPTGTAAAVAVWSRLIFMTVDGVGAAVAALVGRVQRS